MLRRKSRVPLGIRRFVRVQSRPQIISGITRDLAGAPLGGCAVHLYRTSDDAIREVVVSNANGAYTFSAINDGAAYYVVAYKPGAPDVTGTTVNTLVGT